MIYLVYCVVRMIQVKVNVPNNIFWSVCFAQFLPRNEEKRWRIIIARFLTKKDQMHWHCELYLFLYVWCLLIYLRILVFEALVRPKSPAPRWFFKSDAHSAFFFCSTLLSCFLVYYFGVASASRYACINWMDLLNIHVNLNAHSGT